MRTVLGAHFCARDTLASKSKLLGSHGSLLHKNKKKKRKRKRGWLKRSKQKGKKEEKGSEGDERGAVIVRVFGGSLYFWCVATRERRKFATTHTNTTTVESCWCARVCPHNEAERGKRERTTQERRERRERGKRRVCTFSASPTFCSLFRSSLDLYFIIHPSTNFTPPDTLRVQRERIKQERWC